VLLYINYRHREVTLLLRCLDESCTIAVYRCCLPVRKDEREEPGTLFYETAADATQQNPFGTLTTVTHHSQMY
jgi:hypothetical protein